MNGVFNIICDIIRNKKKLYVMFLVHISLHNLMLLAHISLHNVMILVHISLHNIMLIIHISATQLSYVHIYAPNTYIIT